MQTLESWKLPGQAAIVRAIMGVNGYVLALSPMSAMSAMWEVGGWHVFWGLACDYDCENQWACRNALPPHPGSPHSAPYEIPSTAGCIDFGLIITAATVAMQQRSHRHRAGVATQ